MADRKVSVDSFDDFFGVAKTENDAEKLLTISSAVKSKQDETLTKPSSVKPKQDETPTSTTISSLVKTQPVIHHQTPSSSSTTTAAVEKKLPPLSTAPVILAETKPKVNSTKAPVTTTITAAHKNIKATPPSLPAMSNRADSVQSRVYESDFDDDNEYDGDDTEIEPVVGGGKGSREKKKHSSLPPAKERVVMTPRRGSDSELRTSFAVNRRQASQNGHARRKDRLLPYIGQNRHRKMVQNRSTRNLIQQRQKDTTPLSKHEVEQRLLSAQQHKLKLLESRLHEVRQELEIQRIENATLRTIQRREEKVLKKYEDQELDVHRIVKDYTNELEYVKEILSNERQMKAKLEKQIDTRDEKLRDQTQRLRHYEKLVHEKNLDERYELQVKLNETDKKLQELQEKLATQEKYIENLEKNHRHEIHHELSKQRDLKRDLEKRIQNYTDLVQKFEEKTRQVDTMHIYVQRGGQRPTGNSTHISKSNSLQSLQDTSPRFREKITDYDKKRREQQQQEKKVKSMPTSNDSSPKHEKKKALPPPVPVVAKKEQQQQQITKPASTSHISNGEKPSTMQNGHLASKGKPPTRRLSTPKSINEENSEFDEESLVKTPPEKFPPSTTIKRGEQPLSRTQMQTRPPALEPLPASKMTSSGTGGNTSSSLFKLTEAPPLKTRPSRDLDEKWSDMFNASKKDEAAKDDLLAKLVADEQEERRLASINYPPRQPAPMTTFESSSSSTGNLDKKPPMYKSTAAANQYDFDQAVINLHEGKPVTAQPTTTTNPSADPFESLFGGGSNSKPAPRTNGLNDIFSTPSTTQPTTQPKSDLFDSLFGATTTSTTTAKPNSKQAPSVNDKLQRPKVVTNTTRTIPNRTVVEEVEEFVL